MSDPLFDIIRRRAGEIYRDMEKPSFYLEREREIEWSRELIGRSEEVLFAESLIRERGGVLGHGYRHADLVAVEAAAIVFSERGYDDRSRHIAENVLIAGYLHDLRRDEKEHPQKAALEVGEIYLSRLSPRDLGIITFAIRHHEAFREHEHVEDMDYMLCADALYDADKFRWGPDNFLNTLWDMAESLNLSLERIMKGYEKGIEGIKRIRSTFRTVTGKAYGPGFIDAGLKIGEGIYDLCRKELL